MKKFISFIFCLLLCTVIGFGTVVKESIALTVNTGVQLVKDRNDIVSGVFGCYYDSKAKVIVASAIVKLDSKYLFPVRKLRMEPLEGIVALTTFDKTQTFPPYADSEGYYRGPDVISLDIQNLKRTNSPVVSLNSGSAAMFTLLTTGVKYREKDAPLPQPIYAEWVNAGTTVKGTIGVKHVKIKSLTSSGDIRVQCVNVNKFPKELSKIMVNQTSDLKKIVQDGWQKVMEVTNNLNSARANFLLNLLGAILSVFAPVAQWFRQVS